jgi:hypothetical protein
MSEAQPPGTPPADGPAGPRPSWEASALRPEDHVRVLAEHFLHHRNTHTAEALGRAAMGAGYTHDEVVAAIGSVEKSLAAQEASAPRRSLAQRAILAAYGLTYAAFAIVFLGQQSISYGQIALAILTVVLGLALLISILWARRRAWREGGAGVSIAMILSLPIVLLVLVAGTCAVTTFPSMHLGS